MWSLSAIVGVAIACAGIALIASVSLAVTLERRRHRRILEAHGLTRGLSTYHRTKLSANDHNYSHILPPTAQLRRSVQLPFGTFTHRRSEDAVSHGEEENEGSNPRLSLEDYDEILQSRIRKAMRQSFSGRSLHIPKTRRQNKIRKVMPLSRMQNSPLSSITELTDSPLISSPVGGRFPPDSIAEADVSSKPAAIKQERCLPAQWPLAGSSAQEISKIAPTEVMSVAARESVFLRKSGPIPTVTHTSHTMTPIPPSISVTSTASAVPDDPLPPVPTIGTGSIRPGADGLKARTSNASLETVGSSVFGILMTSPKNGTETRIAQHAATNQGLRGFEFDLDSNFTFSTPKLRVPPGKQTLHGLCIGKPSIRSLRPSVDMDDTVSPPGLLNSQNNAQNCCDGSIVREDSFNTIDASHWDSLPPLRVGKLRTSQTPRLNRHSMYEQHSSLQKHRASSESAMWRMYHEDGFGAIKPPERPASVATGNPFRSDREGSGRFSTNRHSMSSFDRGGTRGHKRQNCVRITNLPFPPDLRATNHLVMPELEEEQQQQGQASEMRNVADRPASGTKTQQAILGPRPMLSSTLQSISTPTRSAFSNRPILTPSAGRLLPPPRAVCAAGTPRPDSEVFNATSHLGTSSTHQPQYKDSPRHQWPLSPTAEKDIRLNSRTLSPARHSERLPFDSPTLPSPALKTSYLYPRKSLVKGPRNPRVPTQAQSPNCSSPLQGKHGHGHSYRVVIRERRDSHAHAGPMELDLRRSVMMLRSMNSEGRLLDPHSSKIYRNVGYGVAESSPPESYRMPSPLVNPRVRGLRSSSCSSSIMSVSMSPSPMEGHRHASQATTTTTSRLVNRSRMPTSQAPSQIIIDPPHQTAPAMSISPSVMSCANSIWEDASVRDESPEPEIPCPSPSQHPLSVTPLPLRLKPRAAAAPSSANLLSPRTPGGFPNTRPREMYGVKTDAENATPNATPNLVETLERVVNNGQWDRRSGTAAQAPNPNNRPTHQSLDIFEADEDVRMGIGLGLTLPDPTSLPDYR